MPDKKLDPKQLIDEKACTVLLAGLIGSPTGQLVLSWESFQRGIKLLQEGYRIKIGDAPRGSGAWQAGKNGRVEITLTKEKIDDSIKTQETP